jgi:hypothetical protein
MEGTEEGPSNQNHRSASWNELISLALVLETTVFQLVLPVDDEVQVIVAKASKKVPAGDSTWSYAHYSDRDELSRLLFGLPGSSLTDEHLEQLVKNYDPGATEARIIIEQFQDRVKKALESIEAFKKEQENS